jgi:hypothetical protein
MRRKRSTTLSSVALAAVGLLGLAGCDVDVPDLNSPGLGELEDNPTATTVGAAATGLLIGARAGTSAAGTGYISQLGVVGREMYNFDGADPRTISELLEGALNPASPFGGAFWTLQYTNMRLGDIILRAKENVVDWDDAQKSATSGFVKTIRALDLLRVISTRDTIGAVIDTDHEIEVLGALVSKDETMAEIARLLDEADAELAAGGEAFPFPLSSGFAGFDDPSVGFRQFNRALRIRSATYEGDYDTVMDIFDADPAAGGTFINAEATTEAEFEVGVYHFFGTGSGDVQNGLISVNFYAHPSMLADAEEGDDRAARKLLPDQPEGAGRGLASTTKFQIYTRPDDPVPIIRNEELILLRAEAELFTGDLAAAEADINVVRENSGLLPPVSGLDEAGLLDQLLYERRYSLMLEGHRLIDVRRLDRLEDLPIDEPSGDNLPHGLNIRWPLPSAECDARPGQAPCSVGSRP